ncbi:peptidase family M1 [Seiridium cupressi]
MDAIGRLVLRRSILVPRRTAKDGVKSLTANATLAANACHARVYVKSQQRSHHNLSLSDAASPTRPCARDTALVNFKLRASPAKSIFGARLRQHPPQARPHSQRAFRFISRSFSSTTPASCSTIIPSSIMADRDVLPAVVKPSHYALSISSLEFQNWSYQGKVTIDAEVTEPTKEIVLNAIELKLASAKVTVSQNKATQTFETTKFSYDERKQRATLAFADEIPASLTASLEINFEGTINHDMAGFYRSQYKPTVPAAKSVPRDETFHYMFSTQFESCDARRAFPCFDEPRLKATFHFEIEIPDDQVALSNMPVKSTTPSGEGRQIVAFERTPVMSTYLLAWAVGDFEYIEALTERRYNGKQIPVRVYTTRGLKEQGRWALEHAPKTIDLFSESFGIDYPLPKSDLLAVHEFTHGAMENWGLVTYRTTAVLFDPKTSDAQFKRRIAYVVAHELAHQWFGNLVTMDWWDELWLNESFATWAGWYAIDKFHPDWQVWAQFLNDGTDLAFTLDSLRSSHPVHVPVKDALDVNQIFDHISYLKGCSVLRMLVTHLGVEDFLKGVSIYLSKHTYGNAKTEALWDGLREATGADIDSLMGNWIKKIGFPMLTVAEEPGQITIRQSRFLSTGDVNAEEDETVWWIPLGLQGKVGTNEVQSVALTAREDTIRDIDDDFYKLNHNGTGFYRTNYPPARLAKLGSQLDKLSVDDKASIIGSAAALANAGYATTPALLSFLEAFKDEESQVVWSTALDSISYVLAIFGDDEAIKTGLENFTLKLINDAVEKVGWEPSQDEGFLSGLLRKRLLISAVANNHPKSLEKGQQLFESWSKDEIELNPSLRSVIYRAGVKADPAKAFDKLKKEWETTAAPDGKDFALSAVGHIRDPDLIHNKVIPFLFDTTSDSVPSGDMHFLSSALSANSVARPLLWKWLQENWDKATEKMANPVILDRFVRLTLGKFTDATYLGEIDAFFEDKDTASFNRTLEQVKDNVRARVAYRQRDAAIIKEWLTVNNYIS